MPRWVESESDWDGDEDADNVGESDDDGEATLPCPYCRREIHDEAVQCPYCGNYLSEEDVPVRWKPWWIILGAALCLLVVGFWLMMGP